MQQMCKRMKSKQEIEARIKEFEEFLAKPNVNSDLMTRGCIGEGKQALLWVLER